MPSILHEALVLLFRNRPELAPLLLADPLGVAVPPFTEARVESADLGEVLPRERRADLVVLLLNGKPVLAIVIEVQLHRDPGKRDVWPGYLTSVRERFRCSTCLLVVTTDAAVAAWCAEPIEVGHPGWVLRPLVVGPGAVPIITEEDRAKAMPELSVLSVMAHGTSEHGFAIALAALAAARGLDVERATLYDDLVLFSLNEAAKRKLEEMMLRGGYEYQSELVRKHVAQGRVEGIAEGRAQEAGEAVLTVLEARGLEVSANLRDRILSCTDLPTLNIWLRRAATVDSTEKLLDE